MIYLFPAAVSAPSPLQPTMVYTVFCPASCCEGLYSKIIMLT
jgi:hypothetical protein